MKSPIENAIKNRRLAITIKLEPEENESEELGLAPDVEEKAEPSMDQETAKVLKKGSMMDDEDMGPVDDNSGEQDNDEVEMDAGLSESVEKPAGKASLSEQDIKIVEEMLRQGREPKTITEKMLLAEYHKLKGE